MKKNIRIIRTCTKCNQVIENFYKPITENQFILHNKKCPKCDTYENFAKVVI